MSDPIDLASDIEQAHREAATERARAKAQTQFGTECRYCEEPLAVHRQEYGSCIECQTRAEKRQKLGLPCDS